MAIGPFARVFAQFMLVAGGAVGRAFVNAYKEAASRGGTSSLTPGNFLYAYRRMTVEEAYKVLDLNPQKISIEKLTLKTRGLYEANSQKRDFPGSPYLIRKIKNAETILLEDLKKSEGHMNGSQRPSS